MITIEEGLYNRLSTYSGLTTLISTRVYPLKLPQTVTLPAITYQRISTPRELTHDQKAGGLALPRFQFNCWGTTFSSVKAVVKQLRECLNGFSGTFGSGANTVAVGGVLSANEIDFNDPDSGLYWTAVDYFIYHQE
jgi:hypothetical protein